MYNRFFRSLICSNRVPKKTKYNDIRTRTFMKFYKQRLPYVDLQDVIFTNTFVQSVDPISGSDAKKMIKIGKKKNIWPVSRVMQIYPNWKRFAHKFQARGDKKVGIKYVPGGKDYYKLVTRQTTEYNVREVIHIGKKDYNKTKKELLECTGTTSIIDAIRTLDMTSFNTYADVQNRVAKILKRLLKAAEGVFPKIPKLKHFPKITIQKLEPGTSIAYYALPTLSCKYPTGKPGDKGEVVIQIENLKCVNMYEITALLAHEVFPGHFYQTIQFPRPQFVFANWYVEGWALYVERIVDQFGPKYRAMRLIQRLMRDARCIVDPAIHYKGISFQKAKALYKKLLPHLSDTLVEGDILRYIAMPGQACGYLTGCIRFEKKAKKFKKDILRFHKLVLERGPGPVPYVFAPS